MSDLSLRHAGLRKANSTDAPEVRPYLGSSIAIACPAIKPSSGRLKMKASDPLHQVGQFTGEIKMRE